MLLCFKQEYVFLNDLDIAYIESRKSASTNSNISLPLSESFIIFSLKMEISERQTNHLYPHFHRGFALQINRL